MSQMAFKVTGMVCTGCSDAVQKVLAGLPGVSSASVDYDSGNALVERESSLEEDTVYAAVRDAGFGVSTY